MYFEIYKDAKGEYRWRLKAANHEIIAQGEAKLSARSRFAEKHYRRYPCKRGIKSAFTLSPRPTRAFLSVSDFAGVIARPVAPSLILIFQFGNIAAKLGGVFQQRGRLAVFRRIRAHRRDHQRGRRCRQDRLFDNLNFRSRGRGCRAAGRDGQSRQYNRRLHFYGLE